MNQENNLAKKYDDLESSQSLGHVREYIDYCNFHINENMSSLKEIRQDCEAYTQSAKETLNSIIEAQVSTEKQSASLNNLFEEALDYSRGGQTILTSHFSKTLESKMNVIQNQISKATALSSALQQYLNTLQKSLDSANELSIQISSYLSLTKNILAEGGLTQEESAFVIDNIRNSIAKADNIVGMVKSFLSHIQNISASAFVIIRKMESLMDDAIQTNNVVNGFVS